MQRRLERPAGHMLADDDGTLLRVRGIRYGRADRFAAPQPIGPWSNVFDATARGPACPQLPSRLEWVTGPVVDDLAMSEDCQVLSVTAPCDASGLPVMVWLHGGAYVSGGGEAPKCDADELARHGRVVSPRPCAATGAASRTTASKDSIRHHGIASAHAMCPS